VRDRARRQAAAWRRSRPDGARAIDRIAAHPQATWFERSDADVRGDAARVVAAAAGRATAVVVAYNIPHRDCYSAGGASGPDAYRRWISALASGLGQAPAAVILEPDALPGMDCLSPARRASRTRLLRFAVQALRADRRAAIYLDAGHAAWQPVVVTAARLREAGVARARGFALNVANFRTTRESVAYGHAVSAALGRPTPFVVDTSRNGAGPAPGDAWCNPPGRALGRPPTTRTGDALVDALLWIKIPGESDGTCNGGPPAGRWWPEYAAGLGRRGS
jgi:endoglucanase